MKSRMLFRSGFMLCMMTSTAQAGWLGLFSEAPNQPLLDAIHAGDQAQLEGALNAGLDVNAVDSNAYTALMEAAKTNNIEMIDLLVRRGADLNLIDESGNSALHYASMEGHVEATEHLIDYGADPSFINQDGLKPIDIAIAQKNVDVVSVIDPAQVNVMLEQAVLPVAAAAASGGISTTTVATVSGVAAVGGGAAALAGGGGGGGDSSSSGGGGDDGDSGSGGGGSSNPPVISEFDRSGGLDNINADDAYARGFSGDGVVIAIVDTGVDLDHTELDANVDLVNDYDFVDSDDIANDTNGHGTHVAGIAAAECNGIDMHGVSCDATILPVRVLDSTGSGSTADVADGIRHAFNNGANVINLSLSAPSDVDISVLPEIITALQEAATQNTLVVAATGNDGKAKPNAPATFASDASAVMIAVAAVDDNNVIASYSNRCGAVKELQNNCMVAPGTGIVSTYTGGFLATSSGTSMAAPHVSGAAAIVMERWPFLSAETVKNVLLDTATDLGSPEIYGRGLLNLDAATSIPLGAVSIPLENNVYGESVSLDASTIRTAAAFGDALSRNNAQLGILDGYQRDFTVDLSEVSEIGSRSFDLDRSFERFASPLLQESLDIGEYGHLAFSNAPAHDNSDSFTNNYDVSGTLPDGESAIDRLADIFRASFSQSYNDSSFQLHYNVPVHQAFGIGAIDEGGYDMRMGDTAAANPYLAFADSGTAFGSDVALTDAMNLRFTTFEGEEEYSQQNVSGFASEITVEATSQWRASMQLGLLTEKDTFLGAETAGAFATNQDISTYFTTIGSEYQLGSDMRFFASASGGVSMPQASNNAVLQGYSDIYSSSFSAGVLFSNQKRAGDLFSISVAQPLRVEAGSADLISLASRDSVGNIFTSNQSVNLTPSGREIDFEAAYRIKLNEEQSSLNLSSMYRHQPDHVADADGEGIVMMRVTYQF